MTTRQVGRIAAALGAAAILCGLGAAAEARQHHRLAHEMAPAAVTVPLNGASATVAFSPNGAGTHLIVESIRDARKQVLVQAYGFSSAPIVRALAQAHDRGVDVRVILDRSNERGRYSGAAYLLDHHVPMWIDNTVAIAHNKIMIIDGATIITGSFNFTRAAQQRNAENVLVIRNSPALAGAYARDWDWRLRYSHAYSGLAAH